MLVLIMAITSLLFWQFIIAPTMQYVQYKQYQSYKLHEKAYKLRVVRAFIPETAKLSLDEIEEQYGLNQLYDMVGKLR
jgi:hypothetical protein